MTPDDKQTTNRNSRVTMAVLGVKLDNLDSKVDDVRTDLGKKIDDVRTDQERLWETHVVLHREQEVRIRYLEKHCHDDTPVMARLRNIETEQARQKERLGIWAAGQGLYTTVAAILAALIGK